MISTADFARMVMALGQEAQDDIAWAESLKAPLDANEFASEAIFVICNSGMKNTVARGIYERVIAALAMGYSAAAAFRHKGKVAAIDTIWRDRERLFADFIADAPLGPEACLTFLATLPWIGNITKYHLAKNFGIDIAKPDVHLQRLADLHKTTPQELCADLARETGYRVATVDTVLWRACANGVIDFHTGAFR